MTITQGKSRQVRRMLEEVGFRGDSSDPDRVRNPAA
jgi:hypothetical protein